MKDSKLIQITITEKEFEILKFSVNFFNQIIERTENFNATETNVNEFFEFLKENESKNKIGFN